MSSESFENLDLGLYKKFGLSPEEYSTKEALDKINQGQIVGIRQDLKTNNPTVYKSLEADLIKMMSLHEEQNAAEKEAYHKRLLASLKPEDDAAPDADTDSSQSSSEKNPLAKDAEANVARGDNKAQKNTAHLNGIFAFIFVLLYSEKYGKNLQDYTVQGLRAAYNYFEDIWNSMSDEQKANFRMNPGKSWEQSGLSLNMNPSISEEKLLDLLDIFSLTKNGNVRNQIEKNINKDLLNKLDKLNEEIEELGIENKNTEIDEKISKFFENLDEKEVKQLEQAVGTILTLHKNKELSESGMFPKILSSLKPKTPEEIKPEGGTQSTPTLGST